MKKYTGILAGLLAGMMLYSCGTTPKQSSLPEESSSAQSEPSESWESYTAEITEYREFQTKTVLEGGSLSVSYTLPAGWTLGGGDLFFKENESFYDENGDCRGGFDGCWTGYEPERNSNDFYFTLELDGFVPDEPVTGSRRRVEKNGLVFFCQQYYTEWPQPVLSEYYVWTGESFLRVELFGTKENDSAEEALFDEIICSMAFQLSGETPKAESSEPSSELESAVSSEAESSLESSPVQALPDGWQEVTYLMETHTDLAGNLTDGEGAQLRLQIPSSWSVDSSIIWDNDPADKELAESYGGILKVGEFGAVVGGLSADMTAEDLFTALDNAGGDEKTSLAMERFDQDGRAVYYRKWQSWPGGGAIQTWYPHEYLIETDSGFATVMLYSLEENNSETEALFKQIISTVSE